MMHRLQVVALALVTSMAVSSSSVAAPIADVANPDEALVEKLESTRTSVEYAPEDLIKVVEQLRTQHGLNVQIAWGVLDRFGIRKDKRVEIRLKDVPLSVLLDNIVREIDPSGAAALGWAVDRGVVLISETTALQRQAILKAYDVRDLLESGYAIRRFANTPTLGLSTTGKEWVGGDQLKESEAKSGGGFGGGGGGFGGGGGGLGGGNIFGDPSGEPSRMEKIDTLVGLITSQVASDTWQENGGQLGSINVRDGVLLIRQSLKNHAEIRSVLELLRSVRPVGLTVDVAIVRVAPQRAAGIRQQAGEKFPVIDGRTADELAFSASVDGVLFRSTSGTRNGEAAWISDVTQMDTVAGQHAIVAQQSSEKAPIVGHVHSGLEIIALPLIDADGASATVDVQMAWKPTPQVQFATAGDGTVTAVDRAQQRMRTVSSQSRCKLGDAVVMTIPSTPAEGGASLANDDWLIVRVRAAK